MTTCDDDDDDNVLFFSPLVFFNLSAFFSVATFTTTVDAASFRNPFRAAFKSQFEQQKFLKTQCVPLQGSCH